MSFLAPAAFWLALTLPAILVLYLLKRRYQDQLVSSTYLWRQALRDLEASSPWQKLRRHLLLYLQLLAATLLVLAAVRPALLTRAPTGDIILVLDGSASMQATDVAPSRFELARSRARAIIEGLGRGDRLTLVQAAARPRVLAVATRDRSSLLRALGEARVTAEVADLDEAVKTAFAAVQGQSGLTPRVTAVILSDGRVQASAQAGWPMAVRYERIGTDAGNLAVLAFSVARTESARTDGPQAAPVPLTGLARVANYGRQPVEATLDILAGGQVLATQEMRLEAGEERDLTFSDLPPAADYQARLQPAAGAPPGSDSLAVDDVAYAVSPTAPRAKALLVSAGNRFLERALSLYPGIELYRATPQEYSSLSHPETYALVVFDGALPSRLPPTNLWAVSPDSGGVMGVSPSRPVARAEAANLSDPLLQYVDLDGWRIARSRRVDPGDWARPLLLDAGDGSVLAASGERNGRRYVVWGFDVHDSDLPLRPAFPILVQNTLTWLVPGNLGPSGAVRPGDLLTLALPPGTAAASVVTPDGHSVAVHPGEPFAGTDVPGIYRLVMASGGQATSSGQTGSGSDAAGTPQAAFAVNVNAAVESVLKPAAHLPVGGADRASAGGGAGSDGATEPSGVPASGASGAAQAATVGPLGRRELWPLLILGALGVLTGEWWVSTRGY